MPVKDLNWNSIKFDWASKCFSESNKNLKKHSNMSFEVIEKGN